MRVSQLRLAAVALIGGITLGGCAYGFGDPYVLYGGIGVGYGDSGYGNYGYGDPYGGYGYGYGYPYGGYGSYAGYGSPYYGWYNDWYYPGSGYYVYDRDRHRRQITDAERQYWRDKFDRIRTGATTGTTATASSITPRENWSGFKRVRTRSVDGTASSTSRGSERNRWTRQSSTSSSSSDRSSSRSSSSSSSSDRWHDRM